MQERIKLLIEERKKLLDGGDHLMTSSHSRAGGMGMGSGPSTMDIADTSAMIEKEKHKLEVLKRRQERDIQQVSRAEGQLGREGREQGVVSSEGRQAVRGQTGY